LSLHDALPISNSRVQTWRRPIVKKPLRSRSERTILMRTVSAVVFAALIFAVPAIAQTQPVETEIEGVTAQLLELRQNGGVLRLAVRFSNSQAKLAESSRFTVGRIVLVDMKSKKKYLPIKDAEGQYIGGPIADTLDGGRIALKIPPKQSTVLWAYFEAVPEGTVMSVQVPEAFPFDNVPVTTGTGKVFTASAASSTPGGAVATIVSASRADQVLTVRLRFAAERGQEPDLMSPYFMFGNVFLFDTTNKRKYELLKDTEGIYQAQPVTVKMEGGGFIPDWRKTTLVSLSFQAPPDSVQRVDLMMRQFQPFEAVTIDGMGGAATGGTAAAGTALGLEGALKELNAEVTAAEIKIDLAADVLFDFDKSTIKKEAEPSLRNLATVLKSNAGAAVTIEGHTDAKGADAYNQTLSEQRAASVKQWLVTNAQVNGASITTRGLG